jgi:hypothetical protein
VAGGDEVAAVSCGAVLLLPLLLLLLLVAACETALPAVAGRVKMA